MLAFFSKEGQQSISEDTVDAIDIITAKYRISIRKGGIKIERIEQSAENEKGFVPVYDEMLDLT